MDSQKQVPFIKYKTIQIFRKQMEQYYDLTKNIHHIKNNTNIQNTNGIENKKGIILNQDSLK